MSKKGVEISYHRIYTARQKLNSLVDPSQVAEYTSLTMDIINKILDPKTREFTTDPKMSNALRKFVTSKLAEHYILKLTKIDLHMLDESIKNEHLIEKHTYFYRTLQDLKKIKNSTPLAITMTQKKDLTDIYGKIKSEQILLTHKTLSELEIESRSQLDQNQLLFKKLEVGNIYKISMPKNINDRAYKIKILKEYPHFYYGKTPTGRPETVLKNELFLKDVNVELLGGCYDRI